MADQDISEEVKRIISDQFGLDPEDIEDDSELDADLGISDLDLEDLIEKLEHKFELQIPLEDHEKFQKVADIISYLYENAEITA